MGGKFWDALMNTSRDDVGVPYSVIEEAKREFPKIRHVEEDDIIFDYYVDGEITAWKEEWFGDV